jgi:hypothetical protein
MTAQIALRKRERENTIKKLRSVTFLLVPKDRKRIRFHDGNMEMCIDLAIEGIMKTLMPLPFIGRAGDDHTQTIHLKMPHSQAYVECARNPLSGKITDDGVLIRTLSRHLVNAINLKFKISCWILSIIDGGPLRNSGRKLTISFFINQIMHP